MQCRVTRTGEHPRYWNFPKTEMESRWPLTIWVFPMLKTKFLLIKKKTQNQTHNTETLSTSMSKDIIWVPIKKNLGQTMQTFPASQLTIKTKGVSGFLQLVKNLLEPCNCHIHFSIVSQRSTLALKSGLSILWLKILDYERDRHKNNPLKCTGLKQP